MRRPAAAFTLIELAVVLVVISLLASLTVMTFGGTMDRYRLTKAVEAVESFDAHIRRYARSSQQESIATIDRRNGRMGLVTEDDRESRTFRIPSRVQITKLTLLEPDGTRRNRSGLTRFPISTSGRTPTYAMHLQRGKYDRWVVVLGFSGQVVHFETERQVDALLAL